MAVAGPLWLGKLADGDFCREIYVEAKKALPEAKKRLLNLLAAVLNEADMPPTYYVVDKVCEKLGLRAVSRDRTIEELTEMGYWAVKTHFDPQGIKSNASILTVKEAVKKVTTCIR